MADDMVERLVAVDILANMYIIMMLVDDNSLQAADVAMVEEH